MRLKHPIFGPLIKEKEDNIIFVSDLHLNHDKDFLYARRGFKDVNQYNEFIFNDLHNFLNVNQDKRNYLINLGDTVFGDPEGIVFDRFASLPFEKIYMLAGNHFSGVSNKFNGTNAFEYKNVILLGSNIQFEFKKKYREIILSHFPLLDWPNNALGCLCGHCHGMGKCLNEGDDINGRIFDCGVDNAMIHTNGEHCYFTLEQCLNILNTKTNELGQFRTHRVDNTNIPKPKTFTFNN